MNGTCQAAKRKKKNMWDLTVFSQGKGGGGSSSLDVVFQKHRDLGGATNKKSFLVLFFFSAKKPGAKKRTEREIAVWEGGGGGGGGRVFAGTREKEEQRKVGANRWESTAGEQPQGVKPAWSNRRSAKVVADRRGGRRGSNTLERR